MQGAYDTWSQEVNHGISFFSACASVNFRGDASVRVDVHICTLV